MESRNPVAIAASVTYGGPARAPRPVWVVVPKWSTNAMKVAAGLAPVSRTVVAHAPGEPVPMGPAILHQPVDKGTLPALAKCLLWLEEVCDEATVIVVGPEVKTTSSMVRALGCAVGLLRMDRNRITAIGSSTVVARDDVLRSTLSRFAPEWWWPLWDVRDHPENDEQVYRAVPRADLCWRDWIHPTPGPRRPQNLYQQLHPTPPMADLIDA